MYKRGHTQRQGEDKRTPLGSLSEYRFIIIVVNIELVSSLPSPSPLFHHLMSYVPCSTSSWFLFCCWHHVHPPYIQASVYNEFALKKNFDTSVHLQNFFMYFYGAIFNLVGRVVGMWLDPFTARRPFLRVTCTCMHLPVGRCYQWQYANESLRPRRLKPFPFHPEKKKCKQNWKMCVGGLCCLDCCASSCSGAGRGCRCFMATAA